MDHLSRVPLLSPTEADTVRDQVHDLRDHWTRRHPQLPSWTLGTASYLDGREAGAAGYVSRASVTNPILGSQFRSLHSKVCSALSEIVGDEVAVDAALALPGFHVFLAHKAFEQPVADVHFDLQYQWIDWDPFGGIEATTQISFTLPVRLPSGGAGLTIWKSDWSELAGLSPDERAARIRATTEQVEETYVVGELVVHTGHWLHRIRPGREIQPADERITLQGHAIRTGRGWIAYW